MTMDGSQFMEHRWGSRFDVDVPAEVWTPEGISAGATVRNASLSGALVETELKPALLSRVSLKPQDDPGVRLEACVVRVDPRGIALEWLDPGRESFSALLAARFPKRAAVRPRDSG